MFLSEATQDLVVMLGVTDERLYKLLDGSMVRPSGYLDTKSKSNSCEVFLNNFEQGGL